MDNISAYVGFDRSKLTSAILLVSTSPLGTFLLTFSLVICSSFLYPTDVVIVMIVGEDTSSTLRVRGLSFLRGSHS